MDIHTTEKLNKIALWSIDGIGRVTFLKILNRLKKNRMSWDEFWVGYDGLFLELSVLKKIGQNIKNFKKEFTIYSYYKSLLKKNISVITIWDADYPKLLREIDDYPPILFVKTKQKSRKDSKTIDLFNQKKFPIAIVGTRRITPYGRIVTEKISKELIALGAIIISGFMYGVDVCAQKAAVQSGGNTIGVLGFGFDHMYPKSQEHLFYEMLEKGATFITEFAPHVKPKAGNFPRRNRLVAGLSKGILVTEAAQKSGSHITAQCALDYGRSVFAVPGSILSPYSRGTKYLVNQGAILIESGADIINELSYQDNRFYSKSDNPQEKNEKLVGISKKHHFDLPTYQKKVIKTLESDLFTTEEIASKLNIEVSKAGGIVIDLELKNLIKRKGAYWQLVF